MFLLSSLITTSIIVNYVVLGHTLDLQSAIYSHVCIEKCKYSMKFSTQACSKHSTSSNWSLSLSSRARPHQLFAHTRKDPQARPTRCLQQLNEPVTKPFSSIAIGQQTVPPKRPFVCSVEDRELYINFPGEFAVVVCICTTRFIAIVKQSQQGSNEIDRRRIRQTQPGARVCITENCLER